MTAQCEVAAQVASGATLGFFERWLPAWVFLSIAVGIALGQLFPAVFQAVGQMEVAKVRGIGVTLFVNWAVKPFSMALIAMLAVPILIQVYFNSGLA